MTYASITGSQRRVHWTVKAAIVLCLATAAWALFGAAFFIVAFAL